ncbi:MAG: arginase family protein, partial [Paracoccaceae bacterium]|nr:arginase family protein [Paracoccaceae bacterium]
QNVTSLVLGGDHYITYPILKAHAKIHGKMSLLQFDAHSDTWKANEPTDIDHGTMLYHAINEGLIDPGSSVQVGIRTTNQEPMGMNIIDSFEVHEKGAQFVAEKIREILGNNPTYLTFDIDSLDPAYAPGTGTPVWGGLTPIQVAVILRKIVGINVIGMDVVEVSPPYDTSGITSVAGAHVAVDLICLWASGKQIWM